MALSDNHIDDLDRSIIMELQEEARRPYKEIAAKLGVSESTISNRVNRLQRTGILKLEARVDPFKLANKVAAIIGIKLERRGHVQAVEEIRKIPEVSAVYVATGKYDLSVAFLQQGGTLVSRKRRVGMIVPTLWQPVCPLPDNPPLQASASSSNRR